MKIMSTEKFFRAHFLCLFQLDDHNCSIIRFALLTAAQNSGGQLTGCAVCLFHAAAECPPGIDPIADHYQSLPPAQAGMLHQFLLLRDGKSRRRCGTDADRRRLV